MAGGLPADESISTKLIGILQLKQDFAFQVSHFIMNSKPEQLQLNNRDGWIYLHLLRIVSDHAEKSKYNIKPIVICQDLALLIFTGCRSTLVRVQARVLHFYSKRKMFMQISLGLTYSYISQQSPALFPCPGLTTLILELALRLNCLLTLLEFCGYFDLICDPGYPQLCFFSKSQFSASLLCFLYFI